ncbi:MAG: membrane dipeptidase [Gemmatimonadetes bacterium]|nr:MAG: membrane dipeptidase [Gemmatimonadota bacterium]
MTQTTIHHRALPGLGLRLCALTLVLTAVPPAAATAQETPEQLARRVLSTTPLFDGHNDLPWAIRENEDHPRDVRAYDLRRTTTGHTDIQRLRDGMVGAQFWSVYIPMAAVEEGAAKVQLEQMDIALQVFERYPDVFGVATSTSDVNRVFGEGRIASVMGMEGGHAIQNSLGALRAFYALGARYMTLTHSGNNDWADSATDDPVHGGLTEFGREVVREMNRLGMLVDLSHTSPETMHDALDVAEAPVIFSHSSARGVTDHPRNVPDDVLRRLPENGGVVMVTFVPSFINDEVRDWGRLSPEEREGRTPPRATMDDVIRHIEHIRDVAGIDHVGIGSDFDGISSVPLGLEDVSTFPALFTELARRGWSESDLRKLAGENVLRVWREAEAAARRIQRLRGPSTATIEELDGPVMEQSAGLSARSGALRTHGGAPQG